MSLELIVILCCLPLGVSMLLILAALHASRRPAPEPETWAKCAWCSWWYSSEGKIVSKPPENPFSITPELISHGICDDCRKKEEAEFRKLRATGVQFREFKFNRIKSN
jgi:hypothetical protein